MIINQLGFQQNMISASDDNRQYKVISIIAWALLIASVLNLLTIPLYADPSETIIETLAYSEARRVAFSALFGCAVSILVLLLLKTFRLVLLSGILVTAGILVIIAFSDNFFEIAGGRSTIFFTLPILIAAIIIRPYATFFVTGISTLILLFRPGGVERLNAYAIIAFWMLSLCIWLATSIMEKAIHTAQQETHRVRAMLGVVSHELRTPLGSISGYSDILMFDKRLDELQVSMLLKIKTSTITLIDLVNRLLDLAHIQSGKLVLKPESVTPKTAFGSAVERAAKQSKDKGLQFYYRSKDLPEVIVVDPIRLQQIITNLLDNAIKFTEHGSVILTVRGQAQKILISVSDTGPGMYEKDIQSIFQEFVQLQHYATREYGGAGLGLSIVNNLVSMMNGVISVDSMLGAGTTFLVTLPLDGKSK